MDEKIKLELSSLPDAIDIMEIYRKVNRSYYEIGLLLMTAYNLLKRVNIEKYKEKEELALKIGNESNFFNNVILYNNSVYKQACELCLIPVVETHRDEITEIIESVFSELVISEEKPEDEDWMDKVHKLKEKK